MYKHCLILLLIEAFNEYREYCKYHKYHQKTPSAYSKIPFLKYLSISIQIIILIKFKIDLKAMSYTAVKLTIKLLIF